MEEEKTNILEKVECEIETIKNEGINRDNVDYLYKLIDIHKDLKNEKHWKIKEENMMRYNGYNAGYGDYGRMRDSRGRFMGDYGRRGVPGTGRGRYRESYSEGEDILDDMRDSYSAYSDSMGAYNRGNYSAGEDGMKALEDTMDLFVEFTQKMIQQADSPEAQEIIKKSLKKVSKME